jgi:hypothetical protein
MTTDVTPSNNCSSAAMRMRRHRERRRKSLRHFGVDLKEAEIDALIRKGLLPRESRMDRTAVVNALYAFLDRTLREPL